MKTHYDRNAYKHGSIVHEVNILHLSKALVSPCSVEHGRISSLAQRKPFPRYGTSKKSHCAVHVHLRADWKNSRCELHCLLFCYSLCCSITFKSNVNAHRWFKGPCNGSHGHSSGNLQFSNEVEEKKEKTESWAVQKCMLCSPESTWQVHNITHTSLLCFSQWYWVSLSHCLPDLVKVWWNNCLCWCFNFKQKVRL